MAEIRQRAMQPLVVPVPPLQAHEPLGDRLRKTRPNNARGIAGHDGVGGTSLVTIAPAAITAPVPIARRGEMLKRGCRVAMGWTAGI